MPIACYIIMLEKNYSYNSKSTLVPDDIIKIMMNHSCTLKDEIQEKHLVGCRAHNTIQHQTLPLFP